MANMCWCETTLKGVACRRCHTTLEGAGCWCHTTLVSHHRVLQILTPRFTNFDSAFYKFWLRVLQILTPRFTNFDSAFYKFLTPRFTNFWLRVLQILNPRFTNFWLRVLQIHSTPHFTSPLHSAFYNMPKRAGHISRHIVAIWICLRSNIWSEFPTHTFEYILSLRRSFLLTGLGKRTAKFKSFNARKIFAITLNAAQETYCRICERPRQAYTGKTIS